jgi:hypothetical protein
VDINQSFAAEEEEPSNANYLDVLNTNAEYDEINEEVSTRRVETAQAKDAGNQFEFTLKRPVNLARRGSAMFPLVEAEIEAGKTLVFPGAESRIYETSHPSISVELTNTTGMKLPAGPISVYDNGYAGDALIEFFPENEKRIISYGDDLTVSGSMTASEERVITGAVIIPGKLQIKRRSIYTKVYTIRNASAELKKLIIEHSITSGFQLVEPSTYAEKTFTLYRFKIDLQPNSEIAFTVKEEKPVSSVLILNKPNTTSLLTYSTTQEFPKDVQDFLRKAADLKVKEEKAVIEKRELEGKKQKLIEDQERIRQNLASAGSGSPQGQKYLQRMESIDENIDAFDAEILNLEKRIQAAQEKFIKFIGGSAVRESAIYEL